MKWVTVRLPIADDSQYPRVRTVSTDLTVDERHALTSVLAGCRRLNLEEAPTRPLESRASAVRYILRQIAEQLD